MLAAMRPLTKLMLVAGLLTALTGCADHFKQMIEHRLRHSPDFAPVARTISLNPDLNAALGSPMTIGELELTAYDGAAHKATIDVPVSGPKGKGHAVLHLSRSQDEKSLLCQGGDFYPEKGPPVRLPPR